MAGYICHAHFESRTFDDAITDNCPDCIAAKQAAADRIQREDTIRTDVDYGRHIAIRCTVCGAEGTTKNIRPLGCRTLFVACDHGARYMEVA